VCNSLVEEGLAIVAAADAENVCLRLLGGVGVAVRCASALRDTPEIRRQCEDIDLAGYAQDRRAIEHLLGGRGFDGAKEFNYLAAGSRLLYYRTTDRMKVDVFLDEFRMCHTFPFRRQMGGGDATIGLTDLLLTKLQVVQLSERDVVDLCALLLTATTKSVHDCGGDVMDTKRIVHLCSRQWGWYKTTVRTLAMVREQYSKFLGPVACGEVRRVVDDLTSALEQSPKPARWRLRALVGERVRWYDVPEDPGPLAAGPALGGP